MITFVTMTVEGGTGTSYTVPGTDWIAAADEATRQAERDGYDVLDVQDSIIVIAE